MFLHSVGWSHSLQSAIFFFFEAQALISQFGLPSPFKHPRHKGMACIDASLFINSLKSKSFGAHFSRPYRLMTSSYLLVNSFKAPLPTTQLPHQIPQKPIWFLTFSKGLSFNDTAQATSSRYEHQRLYKQFDDHQSHSEKTDYVENVKNTGLDNSQIDYSRA